MSTLELRAQSSCKHCNISDGNEEKDWEYGWEDQDNTSLKTTNSSITIHRNNVTLFGRMSARKDQAKRELGGILRDLGVHSISERLEDEILATGIRNRASRLGVDIALLSDDEITETARAFVQQSPVPAEVIRQNGGAEDDESSNLTNPLDAAAAQDEASAADVALQNQVAGVARNLDADVAGAGDQVPDQNAAAAACNDATGTLSTAGAAAVARQAVLENGSFHSNSVENLEPLPVERNYGANVSPPRRAAQQPGVAANQAAMPGNNDHAVSPSSSTTGSRSQNGRAAKKQRRL